MNIAEISIKYRLVTLVLTVVLCVAGWKAFDGMGRLEDPEFTIKDAQVVTHYPGGSARQVRGGLRGDRDGHPADGPVEAHRQHLPGGAVHRPAHHEGQVRPGRAPAGLGRAATEGRRCPAQAAAGRADVAGQRRFRRRLRLLLRALWRRLHLQGTEGRGRHVAARTAAGHGRGKSRLLRRAGRGGLHRNPPGQAGAARPFAATGHGHHQPPEPGGDRRQGAGGQRLRADRAVRDVPVCGRHRRPSDPAVRRDAVEDPHPRHRAHPPRLRGSADHDLALQRAPGHRPGRFHRVGGETRSGWARRWWRACANWWLGFPSASSSA